MNYTTSLNRMKREILAHVEKIFRGTGRPVQKFAADMCYGTLESGSVMLSDVAQALQEDTKKINTIERLSRNLESETPEQARDNYIAMVKEHIPENSKDVTIHIDDSDVTKPCGKAFEGLSKVRDGSKSTVSKTVWNNGYYVTEATILTKSMHPVSIFSEIWSVESGVYTSDGQFGYTRKVINRCHTLFPDSTLVMDRGYDDNQVFQLMEKLNQRYVIRLKLNRTLKINGNSYSAKEICAQHKGKYAAKVTYHGKKGKAKITCLKGKLSASDKELTFILVYGLSADHPMILVTNRDVNGKKDALAAMRLYFTRWRVEEYFRCKKQMFDFENFRVRSLVAINSLNFLLSVCMLLLAVIMDSANKNEYYHICIAAAKPIKSEDKVFFFYYRIASGLQELLSKARTGIRDYFKPVRPNQRQMRIRGFA